ncbi:MAG: hypothetical protein ABJF04_16390 [Reichenbachiella sp.]|uniref:lipase family protein n=1 Tax=Reichenbachiella sp. TaxID=2184521 RepID=UPI0032634ABF
MRVVLLILILGFRNPSFAQLREGFDPDEAKALIAICNSYTFLDLYGTDTLIVPKDYRKTFTSEVIGLDNMFQVYESDKLGVINFRGSTNKTSSWVENMYSAMIPGEGVVKINNKDCNYKFASDTAAAVHSGYALAVILLSPILIEQINNLNTKGIYNIMITRHSQGGALAHLSRSYLENLSEDEISPKNKFKTYAFANPMCGNEEFAKEYEVKYCKINMSYSIINPSDLVPKMPMHYQEDGKLFGTLLFKNWAYGIEGFDALNIKELVLRTFEPVLTSYIKSSNQLIERLIATSYIQIDMPGYVEDINYFQTGAIRKLEPFSNPKVPIDTLKMSKKKIAKLKQDEDGNYYNEKASFSQHKPYYYYVAILKEYFSMDYKELDLRYLPEN